MGPRTNLLCALTITLCGRQATASEGCPSIGQIVSLEGTIEVAGSEGTGNWHEGKLNEPLCKGDSVRVGELSRAAIQLANDAVLRLDQSTTVRLLDIAAKKEESSLLELVTGALKSFSRAPRKLAVNTPYVNGMIEGTEFAMRVDGNQTVVTVYEGKVSTVNRYGKLALTPGQSAIAKQGAAPQPYMMVRPQDAVQWTLYYPPIFSALGGGTNRLPTDMTPALRQVLAMTARGDTAGALDLLDRAPVQRRDAQYETYRAALLLNVGRVDEARAAIDRALARDPRAGLAYALRSVIHIVQNQRELALRDAQRAVATSPTAAAKIALSYAQQAEFHIEAARDTMLSAVKEHPDDALAWARLSELWLMLEDRREAKAAARKAEALAPDLARTQLVLGFTALTEFRRQDALQAFQRAIALNSADPLGHFGLGLTQIYQGDLEVGRGELETAVALGSSTALLRAYLGKAYFEEKRYPLDAQQFEIAKQLDPSDPTAYLYDGILKQTVNRPIEALHDIETSIDKNGNRAVYRSRQLLDQDRAARGITLSRVFRDLGAVQLGIRESTKSLVIDPSNASAHRFLSDSYFGVRRREIARVSELLQSQMLQDVNIYPIQPSIAETNLNIITNTGPANPGFNEFTPIFEQNTARLYTSGLAGNLNTYAGEGVLTGLYDRLSLSAGAYHYNTDGWRPNNNLNQTIYDVFAQAALTTELNVQGEVRRRESAEGDLTFNFNPKDFLNDKRINRAQDMIRFGSRYSPTANSNLLFSYIHSDRTESLDQSEFLDPATSASVQADNRQRGNQFEAQYIQRADWFNVIAGAAYAEGNFNTDTALSIVNSEFGPLLDANDRTRDPVKQPRGYVYWNGMLPTSVLWTAGLSYDNYEQGPISKTSLNPKFGVQWLPTKDWLVRAAAFRTLKPVLVNNRTIEPTQVAGFNQLYDDINGTDSWKYGVGLNWRITRNLFLGGEGTWRFMGEPLLLQSGEPAQTNRVALSEDRREQFHTLYLFWTPTDQLIFRAEFTYDQYQSQQGIATDFDNLPLKVATMAFPLGVTYFHPTGFFAGMTGALVDQTVRRADFATQASGSDTFFIFDMAIGYRLPKRYGLASVGIQNLFDTRFQYQDDSYREFRDEPATGPYFPERTILGRLVLNF